MRTAREKLIGLMKLREKLNKEIRDAREEYLVQHDKEPLIYITDHAIIRYLERVKNANIGNEGEPDKMRLYKYATMQNLDIKKLRAEILPVEIQHKIVVEDMSSYYMDGFFYGIKDLALVTIFENET